MELTSQNSNTIYYRLWKFLTARPRREKKIIHPILKPMGLLVLKANTEMMCYKFQNKFIVYELKPFKTENWKNNSGKV